MSSNCCVWLFVTPWTSLAFQASLSFAISHSLLKLMSIELVMPPDHLILYHPLQYWASFHVPSDHLYAFFGEISIKAFCPFLIGLFIICWCWVVGALCIFWKLTPCWSHLLQIFSPIPCVAFLFVVSFAAQNLLNITRSHLFIFAFISLVLGDWSKKMLLWFMSENVLPMFSSRIFMVSYLIFMSLNCFKCILYIVWRSVLTILIYMRLSSEKLIYFTIALR